MVAGVGFAWGYANQLSHRLAHSAPRNRPRFAVWLQQHHLLMRPSVHHVHHNDHTEAFPVLSGHSRGLIQRMLGVVPNGWAWLALFVLLTAFDLVVVSWAVDWIWS